MEKYLICSYRPPSKVLMATKSSFKNACSKAIDCHHGQILEVPKTQSAYKRFLPVNNNGNLISILSNISIINYDMNACAILPESIIPMKMVYHHAAYSKLIPRMHYKETVILFDDKVV